MFITRRTIIALGLAFLLATPAAAQANQDLRSPDTRDAANHYNPRPANPWQDLRSPDTRDFANHYNPQADVSVEAAPEPAAIEATSTGSDWTMTLLAAGGYLLAIAAGVFALRSRKRTRTRVTA
jgi:LPXTG-motif cell wall-anchored protein